MGVFKMLISDPASASLHDQLAAIDLSPVVPADRRALFETEIARIKALRDQPGLRTARLDIVDRLWMIYRQ